MKSKQAVNYTSRDYESIRSDLINYVKKYYPDTYKDFNEASFGSLVLDLVAYVGDNLSFYTDFVFNESNLDTAIKYDNVIKLAKSKGYNFSPTYSSYGEVSFYLLVPVSTNTIAPNTDYMPILRRGSKFATPNNKMYTLIEDVNFGNTNNLIVVGQVDSNTGAPTSYAVKAFGKVVSGELAVSTETVTTYERFRRVRIPGSNITEVVSVFDSNGNKWYEVENLAQNTIYIPVINRNSDKYTVPNILKPIQVSRRYVVERDSNSVYLRFGSGTEETPESIIDPSKQILNVHGKNYVTDIAFDPNQLVESDKMGVAPTNTTLTIVYRVNTANDVNTASGTVTKIVSPIFEYPNKQNLSTSIIGSINKTLEITNEKPITGDINIPTSEEIKLRAYGTYNAQNRAVTKEDYIALVYKMPSNFGAIKRVNLVQDLDSTNQRNLNMYVVSETNSNNLTYLSQTSDTIKQNLKTWISSRKMMNDTIDILDAKIVNYGIRFKVESFPNSNKYSTLVSCQQALANLLTIQRDIGEPIILTDIQATLRNVGDVLDIVEVEIFLKSGINYSSPAINIEEQKSDDGKVVYCPYDCIYELKYTSSDIIGEVI